MNNAVPHDKGVSHHPEQFVTLHGVTLGIPDWQPEIVREGPGEMASPAGVFAMWVNVEGFHCFEVTALASSIAARATLSIASTAPSEGMYLGAALDPM